MTHSKQVSKRLTRLFQAAATITAFGVLASHPAHAQDATWQGATSDWNTNTNWNPNAVPTDDANFANIGVTGVTVTSGTNINQVNFLNNAQSYSITATGASFNVNGTGINNASGVNQTFIVGPVGSAIQLTGNAAVTGSNVFFNNQSGGVLYFSNNTDAGTATINTQNASQTQFFNNATANDASFGVSNGGGLNFNNTATAATSDITVTGATSGVGFQNSATAANSVITNNGGNVGFNNSSTAGSATINNNSGNLAFQNSATAGNSTITNGNGGFIYGFNSATLGNANITNNVGGTVDMRDTSNSGTSDITNNGTVAFRDTSNQGNGSTITNNSGATTFFQNSSTQGTSGSITNQNGGTTRVQNSAVVSGFIINNSGGKTFFQDTSDGQAGLVLTNNAGGTVDISGTTVGTGILKLSGAGDVFLGSKTLTLQQGNISGVIQDGGETPGVGGSLVVAGVSVPVILSGNNTYTGTTTVNSGILDLIGSITSNTTVGVNGTLTGSSNGIAPTITGTLTNNGTLDPGHTTGQPLADPQSSIFVDGVYTNNAGSNFISRVTGNGSAFADSNSLITDDNIFINGGNVEANVSSTDPNGFGPNGFGMETRALITGTLSGVVGGTGFDTLDDTNVPTYLDASLDYSDPAAVLLLLRRNTTGFGSNIGGLSENQNNVAEVLDANAGTAGSGFFDLYDSILLANGNAAQRQALSEASGDALTVFPVVSQDAALRFHDRMNSRFLQNSANNNARVAFMPRARMAYTGTNFITLLAANPDGNASNQTAAMRDADEMRRSNIWATIAGARDNADTDGNGPGFSARATEYQVGYERHTSARTVIGVSAGRSNGRVDVENRNAEGDFDTTSIGLYAQHEGKSFYLNGALSYNRHNIDSRREVVGVSHDADYDARTLGAEAEVGKRYGKGKFSIEPNITLKLFNTNTDSFSEDGGPGAISSDSDSYNSTRLGFGVRFVSRDMNARFRPYASLAYEHEFGDTEAELSNQLIGLGSNFTVRGSNLGKNIFTAKLGTNARLTDRFSLVGEVGASRRSNQHSEYVYGGVNYGF